MIVFRDFVFQLLGMNQREVEPEIVKLPKPPKNLPDFSSSVSTVVFTRSTDAYYHSLTDEEFIDWARMHLDSPQVLLLEDRERVIDRIMSSDLNTLVE